MCVYVCVAKLMNHNPQLKSSRTGVIRIAPPLVVTDEELERGLAIIKASIEELPNFPHTT